MARNTQNLVPFTSETAREAGRKGGIRSGEKKREQKNLQEFVNALLAQKVGEHEDGTPISGAEAMCIRLVQSAMKGDWRAWELARDTAGQKPVEKVVTVGVDQSIKTEVDNIVNEIVNSEKESE